MGYKGILKNLVALDPLFWTMEAWPTHPPSPGILSPVSMPPKYFRNVAQFFKLSSETCLDTVFLRLISLGSYLAGEYSDICSL